MERHHFQQELGTLKERLLAMGGLAEERVRTAMQGLVERDADLIDEVLNGDMPVNELHIEIDDLCLKLLALHSPMAADLRAIMAAIKINSDLERVGDMAVNIGEAARRYASHPPVKKLIDIPRMATTAQRMLRDALDSYVRGDMQLAQQRAGRRRRAGHAEDAGVPRAADLHAAGPRRPSSRRSTSFSFRAISSASATMPRTSPKTSSSWCRAATSAITRRISKSSLVVGGRW